MHLRHTGIPYLHQKVSACTVDAQHDAFYHHGDKFRSDATTGILYCSLVARLLVSIEYRTACLLCALRPSRRHVDPTPFRVGGRDS